jgi:hypothetical protein
LGSRMAALTGGLPLSTAGELWCGVHFHHRARRHERRRRAG